MLTNFSNPPQEISFGLDNVIIPQCISCIPNGRTLDMTGFAGSTISAGWVIITDGKGAYKPLSVHTDQLKSVYDEVPEGWEIAGILQHSLLASRPAASIMTAGQVNYLAAPNNLTAGLPLPPGIQLVADGEEPMESAKPMEPVLP